MHLTFVQIHGRAPRRHEIPKPCDHFDLIVGTGTGGLIAIMLGRLRLDLETCKEVYVRMTRRVFESDKTIGGIPYRSTLFKASKLEEAIRDCVRVHTVTRKEGNDEDGESSEDEISSLPPSSAGGSNNVRRHQSNASVASFSARGLPPQSATSSQGYRDRSWPNTAGAGGYSSYNNAFRRGDANAKLYDRRENRTKTAITAVYRNTPPNSPPALLRSYDSRKEPPPEFNCTIWQAGRATCATGLAFKPIQIGQSQFIDEGHGKFNPAPIVLDEACVNEWPGREIGCFVSLGTGKRPPGSDNQKHLWYEEVLGGDFIEAKRRLVAKIEGCEETHRWMLREGLSRRNVSQDVYYRLNVEVGVGDFGMNEWQALAEISTSTRRYLAKSDVSHMTEGAAQRLARVYIQKLRDAGEWKSRGMGSGEGTGPRLSRRLEEEAATPYPSFAAELPAEVVPLATPSPQSRASRPSYEYNEQDQLQLPTSGSGPGNSPRTSADRLSERERTARDNVRISSDSRRDSSLSPKQSPRISDPDRFTTHAPTPSQFRTARGDDKIAIMSPEDRPRPPTSQPPPIPGSGALTTGSGPGILAPGGGVSGFGADELGGRRESGPIMPPPLPPKTPIPGQERRHERRSDRDSERGSDGGWRLRKQQGSFGGRMGGQGGQMPPPYPLDDAPPAVNMARKPEGWGR